MGFLTMESVFLTWRLVPMKTSTECSKVSPSTPSEQIVNLLQHMNDFNRIFNEFNYKKEIYLPMQFLGPIPNGTYEPGTILRLFSSLKRSGSNRSGSG